MEDKKSLIILTFVHGSFPKPGKKQKATPKRLGGFFGGHIEILIDDFVYGFEANNPKKVHIFSRKNKENFNAKFTKKNLKDWQEETKNEWITSVQIPVSEKQKDFLLWNYETYLEDVPYDYAFFGMRCGSSLYEIFASARIFPILKNRTSCILNAFYPRLFRQSVLNWARINNYKIEIKKGSNEYFWEK